MNPGARQGPVPATSDLTTPGAFPLLLTSLEHQRAARPHVSGGMAVTLSLPWCRPRSSPPVHLKVLQPQRPKALPCMLALAAGDLALNPALHVSESHSAHL